MEPEKPKCEKFILMAKKDGENPMRVQWTGIDQVVNHVKELLEDGWTVQVIPYTRTTWNWQGKKPPETP